MTTTYELTITVSNSGFDNAINTVVTDTIPSGATFVDLINPPTQGSATYDGATSKIIWNVGTLAADPDIMKRSGGTFITTEVAQDYGITDIDGRVIPSARDLRGGPIWQPV